MQARSFLKPTRALSLLLAYTIITYHISKFKLTSTNSVAHFWEMQKVPAGDISPYLPISEQT